MKGFRRFVEVWEVWDVWDVWGVWKFGMFGRLLEEVGSTGAALLNGLFEIRCPKNNKAVFRPKDQSHGQYKLLPNMPT